MPAMRTGIAAPKKSVTGTLSSGLGYRSDRQARVDCRSWRLHVNANASREPCTPHSALSHTNPPRPAAALALNAMNLMLTLTAHVPARASNLHKALMQSGGRESTCKTIDSVRPGLVSLAAAQPRLSTRP